MPAQGEIANLTYDSSNLAVRVVPAGSGATANQTQGNVAGGAADSGNPTKGGSVYNGTPPTYTTGQRTDNQAGSRGAQNVTLFYQDSTVSPVGTNTNADAQSTGSAASRLEVVARKSNFNGASWDREYGNFDTAALINATGATTSQTGADQINYNGRNVKVVLDMTTVGTGSVTLTIQGKDAASGKYYTILAGAAVITNSTNVYEIGLGLPATANVSTNSILPRIWRVITTANNANAATYTVGASVTV